MPEYLAPGVYIEEVSFRSKSIEGVSTTTTGFAGPTRFGPIDGPLDLLTSMAEYERIFGDGQPLLFSGGEQPNYMWHAANAFFRNGGQRLYVARVFDPLSNTDDGRASITFPPSSVSGTPTGLTSVILSARYPGVAGNVLATLELVTSANILVNEGTTANPKIVLRGAQDNDVVVIKHAGTYFFARLTRSIGPNGPVWSLANVAPNTPALAFTDLVAADEVRIVTVKVTISFPQDPGRPSLVYDGLALDPGHRTGGADDSLAGRFSQASVLPGFAEVPVSFTTTPSASAPSGVDWLVFADALAAANLSKDLGDGKAVAPLQLALTGGDDGDEPATYDAALDRLAEREDISIVAAPASGALTDPLPVANALLSHARRLRYRIAVLDAQRGATDSTIRNYRGQLDSTYGALYYPWVTVLDPLSRTELNVAPSGFVAGIYARNDINRGVYKAPANEVLDGAIGLQKLITKGQQDVLNPLGINCFRLMNGYRLWGARTVSSDPEWKYVNLRRYFIYLERSIDLGTQWAVFEPNGERLWNNVRLTVSDFLFNEWQNGALLGDKPEKAFFVKCDRTTMTQNDLDNGRLVCLVGVAALKPAEFVIIRIGQWTADRS